MVKFMEARAREGNTDNVAQRLASGQLQDWVAHVNHAEKALELEALRLSVQRGWPFGGQTWVRRMAKQTVMAATLRPRGRPKGLR